MVFKLNHPNLLWLIIPLGVILFYLLRKQFIKFRTEQEREHYEKFKRQRKIRQIAIGISRVIIIALLLVSLADPYLIQQVTIPGDQSLKILDDQSRSFSIFEKGVGEELHKKISEYIPATRIPFGSENATDISDAILRNLQGNDNILLISDGHNNEGKSLGDLLLFAGTINSTIYTLDLKPEKEDARVMIYGPEKTVAGVQNTFFVDVASTDGQPRHVDVTVDGEAVLNEELLGSAMFKKSFSHGDHKIVAQIRSSDAFSQNNIFYKSVQVVKKPNVAFVSREASPLEAILRELYELSLFDYIPDNTDPYYAVVLNDIPSVTNQDVDKLADFIADGNGLTVIGGQSSYDRGDYKNNYLETILPVKVGTGEFKDADINIVILIDISGSTGATFDSGAKNVNVEKAQAISIIKDLEKEDSLGVLAFNVRPYLVRAIGPLKDTYSQVFDKIYSLKNGGGTVLAPAIAQARQMLAPTKGTKNIVIISDGKTTGVNNAIEQVQIAEKLGITTYAVGIGEDTRIENMQAFADAGGGAFFQPGETSRLRIVLGRPKDESGGDIKLFELFNAAPDHFVTQATELTNISIAGYNQVLPKSASKVLVTTSQNNPIITVWRFGLGRVIAMTTDDGGRWAGPLLHPDNSALIVRAINWGIGSLNRKDQYYVDTHDSFAGEIMEITVKSPTKPESGFLKFAKTEENMYFATHIPQKQDFIKVLDRTIAVNYPEEIKNTGLNPELRDLVDVTGGKVFKKDDIKSIVESIKVNSQRIETKKVHYRWIFVLAALILFFLEVTMRRLLENKKMSEGAP